MSFYYHLFCKYFPIFYDGSGLNLFVKHFYIKMGWKLFPNFWKFLATNFQIFGNYYFGLPKIIDC